MVDVAARQRHADSAFLPTLPEKRFVEYQSGGSQDLVHDVTSLTRVSMSHLALVSVAHIR